MTSEWRKVPDDLIVSTDKMSRDRYFSARATGRVPVNGGPAGERGLLNDIVGGRCEAGGSIYCGPGVHWHNALLRDPRNTPDLDDFIDVKGVAEAHYRLIVQTNANPSWAYLLVRGHRHPWYEIVGWLWGFEAMAEPISDPHGGRPAHFVNRPLRSPPSLLAELRLRARARHVCPELKAHFAALCEAA